jgi:hypothetical protein
MSASSPFMTESEQLMHVPEDPETLRRVVDKAFTQWLFVAPPVRALKPK